MLLIALSVAALAGEPPLAEFSGVTVRYEAAFDLDDPTGRLCKVISMCDCTTTYVGTGANPTVAGGRVTFVGTWAVEANTCHEGLMLWAGGEPAHHSLVFAADRLTGWVAHRDADRHAPLKKGMKAKGQAYLTELDVPWTETGVLTHQEEDAQAIMGVQFASTHALTVTVAR
ncbi:MAG: hypothetical protein ACI8PZ_001399 [Myxococcota bacterium]|jgi:hypothetical protein